MAPFKNVLLLLLALPLCELVAAPVDTARARAAVAGWLAGDPAPFAARLGGQVNRIETFAGADGAPAYYVAALDPAGFVIVAADDLVEPIVGFAAGGTFSPSDADPLGALVSRDLPERLAKARTARAALALAPEAPSQAKWARLVRLAQGSTLGELGITSVSDLRVEPFVQSQWSQDVAYYGGPACYNYYTPPNAEGTAANYPCGCVATAMAQVMRYWQYPKVGVGTAAFSIKVDSATQSRSLRGGDGAGGAYDWSAMPLTAGYSTTLAQRQAIGALCHDAGVAMNMEYAASGSSAVTVQARTAFRSTFKYANAVSGYNSGGSIVAGYTNMVNPNLDAGCPVIFGISGSAGGHSVVCDGYGYNLSTLYHHINLGWGGYENAWYNLPTVDTVPYTFTAFFTCVYNVWTNGTGEIISGRVTDAAGLPLEGVAVTALPSGGGAYTAATDAHGIYALARVPSSSAFTVSAAKPGHFFSPQSVATGKSIDLAAVSGNRWGVNFTAAGAEAPALLTAAAVDSQTVALSWAKNSAQEDILLAWNTNATFGVPSGSYAAGAAIAGGGTVLYTGGGTNFFHAGRNGNTAYYYKAWSVGSGAAYSDGVAASARTPFGVPFAEGFENSGAIPSGWSNEYATGTVTWSYRAGGYSSHPAGAHPGSYNAFLYSSSTADHKTRLVTPAINFGSATRNAQLTFWHCMQVKGSYQDQLRVYYKTSAAGSWTPLTNYTSSVASWTQRTVALPDPGPSYSLAFEGNAKCGYGVCIDDVAVTAEGPAPASFAAWALSNCPGAGVTDAFAQDLDGDGVANGFAYAFGTNLAAGAPLLSIHAVSNAPVVDIPRQLAETAPYVDVYLEMTRSLNPAAWSSNGVAAVDLAGEPADRAWFRPAGAATNAFFRLRGALK